ncbi:hypothetical protein [Micromonospora cremea]|uniref:hypothetical protein n=1 Tax=Micromonospora cremea TaxID=709881 RepID=UPI00117DFCB0|nr:hypothetical protein [Micromonospora cremea]
MTRQHAAQHSVATPDGRHLAVETSGSEQARRDPMTLLEFLRPQLPEADIRVVDDVAIRRLLTYWLIAAVRGAGTGDPAAIESDGGVEGGDGYDRLRRTGGRGQDAA